MMFHQFHKRIFLKSRGWLILRNYLSLLVLIQIPVYMHYYGLANFLWLSDMGLFFTLVALWMQSDLIMSMAAVGIFLLEFVWAIDYFVELIFNHNIIDLSDYMFDPSLPLWLRAISLFHVITPAVWILYMIQYGYDRRALKYFTVFFWCIITSVFLFTDPKENINWVFSATVHNIPYINQNTWLLIMYIGFPLLIFLPTHLIYKKIFTEPKK